MVLKRKQVIIVSLAVLIALAGYLNWSYTREDEELSKATLGELHLVDESSEGNDFFASARLDRELSRSKATETLKSLINDNNTDKGAKEKAEQEVINMAKLSDKENTIESLIRAKGFDDAVVYINDGVAYVAVAAQGMTPADAAKIQEIITDQTGITPSNIKITEVN